MKTQQTTDTTHAATQANPSESATTRPIREQLEAKGFTLECSQPTGQAEARKGQKPWPCIAYNVTLRFKGREVLTTSYKLGVGHVKPIQSPQRTSPGYAVFTTDEHSMLNAWSKKPHADFLDKQLLAQVAAKLAKIQKVTPTLPDVLHSLTQDGEAFFNATSFEEWASDYGYDTDSREAESIYNACNEIGRKLSRGIPAAVLASVREILSNY